MSVLDPKGLTQPDRRAITNLRWMVKLNKIGCGYLGPTVRKVGPVDDVTPCVDAGWAILRIVRLHTKSGYWITDAGRAALSGEGRG